MDVYKNMSPGKKSNDYNVRHDNIIMMNTRIIILHLCKAGYVFPSEQIS